MKRILLAALLAAGCGKSQNVDPSNAEPADLFGFWVASGDGYTPTVLQFGDGKDHVFPELVDVENPWFLYQNPAAEEVPVGARFMRQTGTFIVEQGKVGTWALLERDGREIYATDQQYENTIIELVRGESLTLESQVSASGERTFEFYDKCPKFLFEDPESNIVPFQMPEAEFRANGAATAFGLAFDPRDEEPHMIWGGPREGYYGTLAGHCEAFPRAFPQFLVASMTSDETGRMWAVGYEQSSGRTVAMSLPPDQLDEEWTFDDLMTSNGQPGVDIGMGPDGPFIVTSRDGIVTFYERMGESWVPQQVTASAEPFSPWASGAVGPDGTAYVAYAFENRQRIAARIDGAWIERDLGIGSGIGGSVTVAPDGTIALVWDTLEIFGDLPAHVPGVKGTDVNGFHAADTLLLARGKTIQELDPEEIGQGTYPIAEYDPNGTLHIFTNGLRRFGYLYYRIETDGEVEIVGQLRTDVLAGNAVPATNNRPRLAVSPSGKAMMGIAPVASIYDPTRRDVRPKRQFTMTVSGPGSVTLPSGDTCASGETCEFQITKSTIEKFWIEPEAEWAAANFNVNYPNLGARSPIVYAAPSVDYRYYFVASPDAVFDDDVTEPVALSVSFQ